MDDKQKIALGSIATVVPGGLVVIAIGAAAFIAGRALARSWKKDLQVRKDLVGLCEAERAEYLVRHPD
ncbi:MAG TPA: hypothetical protein VJ553_05160 [Candidatus Paceibacterota bacterium]|nr:hypothetical protein [Candidatus Paceibacterota bacterium]